MMRKRYGCSCIFERSFGEPIQYCSHHARKRDEIERLTAKVAELEAALRKIASMDDMLNEAQMAIVADEALAAREKKCEHPWHRSNLVSGLCPTCKMTVEQFNSELEEKQCGVCGK
jgi:hypothetical protein